MQQGYTAHVIQREAANVAKLPLLNVPAIELLNDEALQHTNIAAASSTHKGSPSEHEPCRGTTCICSEPAKPEAMVQKDSPAEGDDVHG